MQITAKLIQKLPLQSGAGKNGEWKKQDIIVETDGQYPKKICISLWNDKINDGLLQPGNIFKIEFDVESREFNSRWYTDVKAWKIEMVSGDGSQSTPAEDSVPLDLSASDAGNDLPF